MYKTTRFHDVVGSIWKELNTLDILVAFQNRGVYGYADKELKENTQLANEQVQNNSPTCEDHIWLRKTQWQQECSLKN